MTRGRAGAAVVLTLVLMAAATGLSIDAGEGVDLAGLAFIGGIGAAFAAVGMLIAVRQPGNVLAPVFLLAAVGAGLALLSGRYATWWLDTGNGPDALGEAAAAYGELSWIPFILVPLTFLLLLFPDGRLLSRRWRWIGRAAAAGIALTFITGLLKPGRIPDFPQLENPLGVRSGAVEGLEGLGALLVMIGVAGSVTAMVLRFRRARGVEHQQLKWIAYAGAVAGVALVIGISIYDLNETAANSVMMAGVLTLPVATGVAIARYRLYDIDLVVNRTLVYGALTALLGGLYLGLVLLLQLVLSPGSDLAIAASTLAVAALARPLLGRVQQTVDRRFYRSRYDAAQTIESFGARLRDQVELDAVSSELGAVARDTLQPAHVSLWLRGAER